VCTIFLDSFSSHDCWETFASSDDSLNSSFSIGTIGGFEGITTSFAMIEPLATPTKTKRVVRIIWYLHFKEIDAFV
jgi:hypothetical protein